MILKGRREIFTDVKEITKANICEVMEEAFSIHSLNASEIKYLQEYERGVQPIQNRVKEVRPEINYKVVENHAAEITAFKVGYVFGSPITFVQRASTDINGNNGNIDDKKISILNEMMFEEGKITQDQALGKDLAVTGLGYRIVLPKKNITGVSVFDMLRLNPNNAFVIRFNDIYKRVAVGVSYVTLKDGTIRAGAYTDKSYFELEGAATGSFKIINEKKNMIGIVPIIEYRYDEERMCCFERVVSLLDALNEATSDRLNGLAQFVQSILWMNNCEVDKEQMEQLKDKLGLLTKSEPGNPASVQYLTATLDQTQTQTLVDYLYEQILQIAGVPGREQSTGGNTGQAIMLSNGWQIAENHARSTVQTFIASELEMLKVVLKIFALQAETPDAVNDLKISDIDVKFARNRTDSLLVKTQGLLNQLKAGIHPLIAISNCDLYSDPQSVWNDSKAYMGKWLYDAEEDDIDAEETVSEIKQSGGEDNQEVEPTVSA
jgi:SPP1 family phage portal protein